MHRFCPARQWISKTLILLFGVFLIPSMGLSESLKDGIIMRDGASIFMKDGSSLECNRFWWIVSGADFVQCDRGNHAVDVKIEEIDFEKTFGPELAWEYVAIKEDLAASHEKSLQKRQSEVTPVKTSTEDEKAIERRSGTQKEPVAANTVKTVFGEWYSDSESIGRAIVLASEYLEFEHNWTQKPFFRREETITLVNANISKAYLLSATIPADMLPGPRCTWGIQRVKVRMEYHEEKKELIRFLGVELSDQILLPHGCNK